MSLKNELKELIIKECEKDFNPQDIDDDEILFGEKSVLQLDSLDALQISMALERKYGIKLTDSKKTKKVMKSINSLAKYVQKNSDEK